MLQVPLNWFKYLGSNPHSKDKLILDLTIFRRLVFNITYMFKHICMYVYSDNLEISVVSL